MVLSNFAFGNSQPINKNNIEFLPVNLETGRNYAFTSNNNMDGLNRLENQTNIEPKMAFNSAFEENNSHQAIENYWTNLFNNNNSSLSNSTPTLNTVNSNDLKNGAQTAEILSSDNKNIFLHNISRNVSTNSYSVGNMINNKEHKYVSPNNTPNSYGSYIQTSESPLSTNSSSLISAQQQQQQQKNPKLYKTELCRSWVDTGRCNYGERCQYAHGDNEKRPIPRHPKYKTEACQSFHKTGYCPYGPRCHFIHSHDESNVGTPTTPSTTINPFKALQVSKESTKHQPLNITHSAGEITNNPFTTSNHVKQSLSNNFVVEPQHYSLQNNLQHYASMMGQPPIAASPQYPNGGIFNASLSDDSSLQSSSGGDSGTESPICSNSSSFSPALDLDGTPIKSLQNIIIPDEQQKNNFNEIQLANNLAASLSLIKNETGQTDSIQNMYSPSQQQKIWIQNEAQKQKEMDFFRRASGSSLGSAGNGKIFNINGTNSTSFASTSVSSTEDFCWPINKQTHQQQPNFDPQQQNIRLPIFEQLSNGPF